MALNDDAVFIAARGYIYFGDVGTAAPTAAEIADFDPETFGVGTDGPGVGWDSLGHTSEEDLPEFGYEGGDTEAKSTWQKKNLKQVVTEAPVDHVTMKAQQFDIKTLEYYYGKNASLDAGVFGIDTPTLAGIDKAILIVLVDGDNKIAFTAAKSTVGRDESVSMAIDDFSTLPLKATFVKHTGRRLFEWILPASV